MYRLSYKMLNHKKTMLTPANIVLIGGLVTIILTYIATTITDKQNKDDQQKLKDDLIKQTQEYAAKIDKYAQTQKSNDLEIKELQRQLIKESQEQASKSNEIASLAKKLADSQEKLANLSQETQSFVTGGNGYCYVNIYPDAPNSADLDVLSESEYPLYDVEIIIMPWFYVDDFYIEKEVAESYKKLTDFDTTYKYKIGTLSPKDSQLLRTRNFGRLPFNIKANWVYTIDFITRNGEWRQIWEIRLDEKFQPYFSWVVYKSVVENSIIKKIFLHKFINPKMKNSILEYLIIEKKIQFSG